MKVLGLITFSIAVLLFAQGCEVKQGVEDTQPDAEACHFQLNSYMQRISWVKLPVTIYADSTLDEELLEAVKESLAIWNEAFKELRPGKSVFVFGGKLPGDISRRSDGINVIGITKDWQGLPTEQAQTTVNWQGRNIYEADITINGNKSLSILADTPYNKIDAVALIVHELGHVLGLAHIEATQEIYTSMNAYLAAGDSERREVGDIDLDALKCEY